MKKQISITVVAIFVSVCFAMNCSADSKHHGGHYHDSGWNDWAAAMTLGILGLGLWSELNRPYYPPPQQQYMQQLPEEVIQPGYMYYCVYSNGYYPYVKGCPGGWLKVVPIPQAPPE